MQSPQNASNLRWAETVNRAPSKLIITHKYHCNPTWRFNHVSYQIDQLNNGRNSCEDDCQKDTWFWLISNKIYQTILTSKIIKVYNLLLEVRCILTGFSIYFQHCMYTFESHRKKKLYKSLEVNITTFTCVCCFTSSKEKKQTK